jgi:hypothetical protein
MLRILCKECNTELEADTSPRGHSCHCPNETYVRLDKYGQPVIMGKDLSKIQIIEGLITKSKTLDKSETLIYNKRKVRKLDYEVR